MSIIKMLKKLLLPKYGLTIIYNGKYFSENGLKDLLDEIRYRGHGLSYHSLKEMILRCNNTQ
jgi:hypothetical protein